MYTISLTIAGKLFVYIVSWFSIDGFGNLQFVTTDGQQIKCTGVQGTYSGSGVTGIATKCFAADTIFANNFEATP